MSEPTPRWDLTVAEARALQEELRARLVLEPPPGFAPRRVAGADVSAARFGRRGYAAVVTLDLATLQVEEQATAAADLGFPYVPGYLAFRELPVVARAWERLRRKPDVLVFDGQGLAHPRRFGLACYGGLLFGVPSVGCAKSLLLGEHAPLGRERGATAALVHRGEVVGMAVRTRDGCRPLYVSPGHLMDLETAVRLVLALTPRYRQPETTRRSHALVNDLRRAEAEPPPIGGRPPPR
ncbi:MAG TPA: endonuclease V [Longimicrobiaceae bacterium]|nr:endonuclease V [Longimicrobiaceae bacterium]